MDMGLEEALRRAVSTLRRVAQHIPGGKPDYAFCGIASMNYYGEAMRGPLRALCPTGRCIWRMTAGG